MVAISGEEELLRACEGLVIGDLLPREEVAAALMANSDTSQAFIHHVTFELNVLGLGGFSRSRTSLEPEVPAL